MSKRIPDWLAEFFIARPSANVLVPQLVLWLAANRPEVDTSPLAFLARAGEAAKEAREKAGK